MSSISSINYITNINKCFWCRKTSQTFKTLCLLHLDNLVRSKEAACFQTLFAMFWSASKFHIFGASKFHISIIFGRSHVKSVAVDRLDSINIYCKVNCYNSFCFTFDQFRRDLAKSVYTIIKIKRDSLASRMTLLGRILFWSFLN